MNISRLSRVGATYVCWFWRWRLRSLPLIEASRKSMPLSSWVLRIAAARISLSCKASPVKEVLEAAGTCVISARSAVSAGRSPAVRLFLLPNAHRPKCGSYFIREARTAVSANGKSIFSLEGGIQQRPLIDRYVSIFLPRWRYALMP